MNMNRVDKYHDLSHDYESKNIDGITEVRILANILSLMNIDGITIILSFMKTSIDQITNILSFRNYKI